MPITTQFSKHSYDTLGHEIADELVAWFNKVDASYRTEFSELFKLHFDRFNDRLEREIGGLRSELQREVGGVRSELDGRVGGLRSEMEARFVAFEAKVEQRIAAAEVRLIRWMFLFWVGSIGTRIALNQL